MGETSLRFPFSRNPTSLYRKISGSPRQDVSPCRTTHPTKFRLRPLEVSFDELRDGTTAVVIARQGDQIFVSTDAINAPGLQSRTFQPVNGQHQLIITTSLWIFSHNFYVLDKTRAIKLIDVRQHAFPVFSILILLAGYHTLAFRPKIQSSVSFLFPPPPKKKTDYDYERSTPGAPRDLSKSALKTLM